MQKYARIRPDGGIDYMPAFTDGVCNFSKSRAEWRQENGWLPMGAATPPPAGSGKISVRTAWAESGGTIVPVWTETPAQDAPQGDLRRAMSDPAFVETLTGTAKDAILARLVKAVLCAVLACACAATPEFRRFGDLVNNDRVVVDSGRVSPFMWPGDWFIRVDGVEAAPGATSYLAPLGDMLASYAGGSGVWHGYRLSAEADPVAVRFGDEPPPVTFSYHDPFGAVSSFSNNVLRSSGVPGTVHVMAEDTNGVRRAAAVVMTPVNPGKVVDAYAMETNVTERFIWATNLFSRLAAVSDAASDRATNWWCRSFENRYGYGWANQKHVWTVPRQLNRFGSDGRVRTNEWPGAIVSSGVWKDLATPDTPRAWSYRQNRDFFWPELQTNLWCISSALHEGQASPPCTGQGGWRSIPCLAVAPHYYVFAAHYGDWGLSAVQCNPRFVRSTADNDYVHAQMSAVVGSVPYGTSGSYTDIRLVRSKVEIPPQCIARFATRETLESLSPTLFRYVPCLTVNAHQSVTPYCLGGTGSTLYGWSAEPRTSAFKSPYRAGVAVPDAARNMVHMGHMYDSGDVFFLAAPNGRVVPMGQTHYLTDGGGVSGPSYIDGDVLENLSAMIRVDSGGTEDLSYWTAADLWAGGVTNLVEEAE